MTNECDVGGCCSLPTERADCASFAVGSAARRGSRRRGASSWSAFSDMDCRSLLYRRGLRRCPVGAAQAVEGRSERTERLASLRLRAYAVGRAVACRSVPHVLIAVYRV